MCLLSVNTNDAFVGIDGATMETNKSMTIYPKAFDAGKLVFCRDYSVYE